MNKTDEKIEYIIGQAMDMRDDGKNIADILSKFPEFQKEIEDAFLVAEVLKNSKKFNDAPKDLLQSIVNSIPKDSVTYSDANRYTITEDSKGRIFQQIISNVHFFTMNKKLAGLFVMLLAIVLGSVYFWQQRGGRDAMTEKLASIEAEFNQDFADIEYIAQDTSLDSLETELAMISENDIPVSEKTATDSASIDALDADLADSLDSLSGDFNDIEGVANDMSLDSLDSGLSGI